MALMKIAGVPIERPAGKRAPGGHCWFPASNTRIERIISTSRFGALTPFLGEARETDQLLTDAAEEGGAAVLAHPGRREAWKALGEIEISRLAGVEVWNRKYDGWAPGRAGVGLAERHRDLVPFFGLDFHTARQFHPIGMSFDIEGAAAADAIVDALLSHRCGPVAFGVEGKRLMSGPAYALSRSAESSRRAIRPAVRRWRRFRGSTTG